MKWLTDNQNVVIEHGSRKHSLEEIARVQGQTKRNKCIGTRDGDRRTATGTQGKGQVQEKNGLEHTLGQMDMDRRSGTVTYRQEIGTQTERHMFCHHWYLNFGRRDFCKKYANTPLARQLNFPCSFTVWF